MEASGEGFTSRMGCGIIFGVKKQQLGHTVEQLLLPRQYHQSNYTAVLLANLCIGMWLSTAGDNLSFKELLKSST